MSDNDLEKWQKLRQWMRTGQSMGLTMVDLLQATDPAYRERMYEAELDQLLATDAEEKRRLRELLDDRPIILDSLMGYARDRDETDCVEYQAAELWLEEEKAKRDALRQARRLVPHLTYAELLLWLMEYTWREIKPVDTDSAREAKFQLAEAWLSSMGGKFEHP